MHKRLTLILALAFVVGVAFTAYAEVQNVKVSGDITALGIVRNTFSLNKAAGLRDENALASIARVKIDADLTDNVMTTVRLLNERYWGTEVENNPASGENSNIDLDLAYATLKEFLYSPLTLTVGRQELHFGNEMIVGDVDTNRVVSTASAFRTHDEDLSARKSFDAIRATLDYNPLVVDLIYAKINENNVNSPTDDRDLYGLNAKYDTKIKNTTVEGYWFAKDAGRKFSSNAAGPNKRDNVYTVGALVKSMPKENLSASFEAAYQYGNFVDNSVSPQTSAQRKAWALEAGANYRFAKVKYTPSLTILGAWFSGQKNPGRANTASNGGLKDFTGWDPMFENQKYGDIANAQLAQTNARLVGGILSARPMEDVTLSGEYYAYWFDRPFITGFLTSGPTVRSDSFTMKDGNRFAGQEIDLKAIYDYTEDVQLSLMGGWFLPGSAFADQNDNTASEVIGSMKVTF